MPTGINPSLSVITPSLNSLDRLQSTVDSVQLELSRSVNIRIEHIVVDGESKDGTVEFFNEHKFPGLTFLTRKDDSLYEAIARGFQESTGHTIVILGAGDLLLTGASDSILRCTGELGVSWGSGFQHFHTLQANHKLGFTRVGPTVLKSLARAGSYGRFAPAIQQESTFFSRELLKAVDINYLSSLKLAGDSYLWSCFSSIAEHHRFRFLVGSFMLHDGQLSENMSAYRQELAKIFPGQAVTKLLMPLFIVNLEWLFRNITSEKLRVRSD